MSTQKTKTRDWDYTGNSTVKKLDKTLGSIDWRTPGSGGTNPIHVYTDGSGSGIFSAATKKLNVTGYDNQSTFVFHMLATTTLEEIIGGYEGKEITITTAGTNTVNTLGISAGFFNILTNSALGPITLTDNGFDFITLKLRNNAWIEVARGTF